MKDTHKVNMNSYTSSLKKLLLFLLPFSLLSEFIHKTCRNIYEVIKSMISLRLIIQVIEKVASDNSGYFQVSKLFLINTDLLPTKGL